MFSRLSWLSSLGLLALLLLAPPVLAEPPSQGAQVADAAAESDSAQKKAQEQEKGEEKGQKKPLFIRIRRDEDQQPLALETPIIRYRPADGSEGPVIDLVGAVHVGEKSYYETLNKKFTDYDAVLYELVAPEGTRIPKGQRAQVRHPVSGLQLGLKSLLGLEFQLEQIDYTKKNLIHADMSPKEFAESMEKRGESFAQMFFRMMGQGIAAQANDPSRSTDAQLLFAFFAKDRTLRLKRTMAEQMQNVDGSLAALDGPDGSTIITHRNRKAFEVLDRELKAGKKRIAVFYGAGHLPDMEKRLLEQFGMKRSSEEWLPAWSLAKEEKAKEEKAAVESGGK